jgi:hypothetical protein
MFFISHLSTLTTKHTADTALLNTVKLGYIVIKGT